MNERSEEAVATTMPNEEVLPPPRVLIVMADQWRRAGLRAALRAEGYDAIGFPSLRTAALVPFSDVDRGPVRATVIDQDALAPGRTSLLDALPNDSALILVARATVAEPVGQWRVVLRRPVAIGDIVRAVEAVVPLPADQRRALDDSP
ncbi:MAG: hypothetical protein ACJ796_15765 [Gemmatimonadaceae bacterium]